ncbi:MAG: hypothetical protein C4538_12425 [Nitrospiraceae bacterium]|nr:MAG: hypothetical protein C4538_12425 [Nitrospiraceae bacterium]
MKIYLDKPRFKNILNAIVFLNAYDIASSTEMFLVSDVNVSLNMFRGFHLNVRRVFLFKLLYFVKHAFIHHTCPNLMHGENLALWRQSW